MASRRPGGPSSGVADLLAPGLRVVIAGTSRVGALAGRVHHYAGAGNSFWVLLHESGLVPDLLTPAQDEQVLAHGVGLTDLLGVVEQRAGEEPVREWLLDDFHAKLRRARPGALAFVSKTAATYYARATGQRAPRDYGPVSWTVQGCPAFVLPGPSGANNGMPLPLRIALWRDLADFLDTL